VGISSYSLIYLSATNYVLPFELAI